jgi:hypothetical protein
MWIGSYLVLALLYILNASWTVARFMLPAFPAIAMIWGHGLQKIKTRMKKAVIAMIAIAIIGFVLASFIKISLAAKSWDSYKQDFEWAESNTNKNEKFITGSQCISYNIRRQTVAPEADNPDTADYAFANQNFRLDRMAILSPAMSKKLDGNTKVYENRETGTIIYKMKG